MRDVADNRFVSATSAYFSDASASQSSTCTSVGQYFNNDSHSSTSAESGLLKDSSSPPSNSHTRIQVLCFASCVIYITKIAYNHSPNDYTPTLQALIERRRQKKKARAF